MSEMPLWVQIADITAMLLDFAGGWLIARRNRWGFVCWFFPNTVWGGLAIYHQMWGLAISMIVYLGLSVYGVIYWKKKEDEPSGSQ
jgi:hypothetical protein